MTAEQKKEIIISNMVLLLNDLNIEDSDNRQFLTETCAENILMDFDFEEETYHKSKVEAITDEMIEKEFKYDDTRDSIVGAKWFKEQLLKQ